ncbi:MAG: hypothetical protein COV55_02125 [Candidatus Komeilibacteria bacterium CG11_big_fil_rev_8_21_14_0_20_36_20]|uniref:PA14 domain-containing protein n=1 Tax=Candidatus Komeilibacteria bacterium CG11_big_fil_rev_8_21_14_0_20_36_20 TaxID=1974477 RepID=A0A2H0NDB3_9BACT|nr:MAG: hypothetical protein COV55_02125 [Candidatus Komeilibacteria bacterium CG11_big_fil_rev_8_21_14_0_20_36_20]PIR81593.1 MAG: hypothetical protein COU21_02935 [Candidatus Komeilibacteria bacterium CG10_big_fil_rev_8_21_14_0_10_36_65]PJC55431.1 MAG: hypothetical protein CO027_02235 [Candidatus Komeilibacteria bacterium CG_4_9_14_0_2_um_filter_36_13]
MKTTLKTQKGAAAIIGAIVVAAGVLSISLSVTIIALNNKASLESFADSVQSFYSAEAGAGEALMQLRKEPANLTFNDIVVGGLTVSTEFIEEEGGSCDQPEQCDYPSDSGWWSEYFNYSVNHPDMEVNPYPGPTPTPTEHDWYDDNYKTHEQIDANLEFLTSMWFPYDGTEWEDMEGFNHDYHFGMHWRAIVTAPADDNYSYALASDDDSWVLVGGIVIVNNSGTHPAFTKTGDIFLTAGDNIVEIYFTERHTIESGMSFSFDDPSLIITPYPEGCGEDLECNSNIEATASTTKATRKVRYTCNNQIANCLWSELTP